MPEPRLVHSKQPVNIGGRAGKGRKGSGGGKGAGGERDRGRERGRRSGGEREKQLVKPTYSHK